MFRPVLAAALVVIATSAASTAMAAQKSVIFAGGCFWCVEKDFDHVPGVISTVSGYAGGTSENPTYKNHTAAGHREVVKIEYDDARVSFDKLLDVFCIRSTRPTLAASSAIAGTLIRRPSMPRTRPRLKLPRPPRRPSRPLSASRLQPRSHRRRHSGRPRNTIRTTIRRTRSAIGSTGHPAGATAA